MKRTNRPVILTDKEIDAVQNVTALAVVRAENGNGPRIPHLISAVIKIGLSRCSNEIEIPAERLGILEE